MCSWLKWISSASWTPCQWNYMEAVMRNYEVILLGNQVDLLQNGRLLESPVKKRM